MGQSTSSRRRDDFPPPSPAAFASSSSSYPTPPPPPPSYVSPAYLPASSRPAYTTPYQAPPPYSSGHYRYVPPYHGARQGSGWWSAPPSSSPAPWMAAAPRPPPPPYVEHQKAKTIKNDVNLHKDTIRLVTDELNPDQHLVSFTFDALVDGSVTIFYFAKEGTDCTFSPVYPDMYKPMTVPFKKGIAQKFYQPAGSGIDLGFFLMDDLAKPLDGDIFPLVIYAEGNPPALSTEGVVNQSKNAIRAQITQAVIVRNNDGSYSVKVMKQILWVDGERYELQEIFGLESSREPELGDVDDMGKECVICLSEPRDTAAFPCRHLCLCGECAKELRLQSNKCPICRQPIEKFMEIKVDKLTEVKVD